MAAIATTVSTLVNANQLDTFEHIVPIDLSSIFTGYGHLPAVTETRNQVGDWDATGQTRTVQLSDGSTVQEELTEYMHPHSFSYTVSNFSSPLGLLTTSANGTWWFEPRSANQTQIKWQYAFNARSVLAVPGLWFITNVLWRSYMVKALSLAKQQLEHH